MGIIDEALAASSHASTRRELKGQPVTAQSTALRSLFAIAVMSALTAAPHAEEQQGSPQATRKACPTVQQQQQQAGKTNATGN